MKQAILFSLLTMVPFAAAFVTAPPPEAPRQVTLRALRDMYRPLLVFAPTEADPRLSRQLGLLAQHGGELEERQVLVICIAVSTRPEPSRPDFQTAILSGDEEAKARRRFRVAAKDFTVILLGKDGGEKLRSDEPIAYETLRDTIDAMPMRQQEMSRPK